MSSQESTSSFRTLLHKFIPSNFEDVFGLVGRLLQAKHSAGRRAMLYSGIGLGLTPFDILFQGKEKKLYEQAPAPQYPILFVVGAPRSGTTITEQLLINHLPLNFFNNLTSLFPRSPLTAHMSFGQKLAADAKPVDQTSLYGRTVKLSEPNDALYFWDRWTGHDRKEIPLAISPENQEAIRQFYGAWQAHWQSPIIHKVNRLNTFSHLVADVLPTAKFICLDRNPIFHAQSLLVARRYIHGNDRISYGIQGDQPADLLPAEDPIEAVCQQVLFHKRVARTQRELIGEDRFMVLGLESFLANPAPIIAQISQEYLNYSIDEASLAETLAPFAEAAKRKPSRIQIDPKELMQIVDTFRRLTNDTPVSEGLIAQTELEFAV